MLTVAALTRFSIPSVALGALGILPLAASLVDAVRLIRLPGKAPSRLPEDRAEVQDWITERADELLAKEKTLQSLSLSIQQWLQFPPVIDFRDPDEIERHRSAVLPTRTALGGESSEAGRDPMSEQDRQLVELIDSKTRDLFERIKRDAFRKEVDGVKSLDLVAVRSDVIALVSAVTAIYRPDDPDPFLKTNAEAVSRAIGRCSLRMLVLAEQLPGKISSYDFQSIYQFIRRGVQAYGAYRAAKPYLDIASGLWFAGRLASATNPVTYVAWWAATKATTFGASKLGGHVIDQQAVGLIRQLVEILSLEVASIYSPQVRYRDIHWVYAVELVQLFSEVKASDSARLAALQQISTLNLLDEFGRMALLRQLSLGVSRLPVDYQPSRSLPASDRLMIAERLETFLMEHVLTGPTSDRLPTVQ
ncbi:MAG: hypothetical protein AAGJ83_15415, partial [Planctomycetota bacterium]